jgi:hypothetical protein
LAGFQWISGEEVRSQRSGRPTDEQFRPQRREIARGNLWRISGLRRARLGMLVAIERYKRGVPMNMDSGRVRQAIRAAWLVGASALILGPVVLGTAASWPSPRQDVRIDIPSNPAPMMSADRTLVIDEQPELKKDENFTNETKVVEYRFRLDSSSDMVHLNISAEVEHGLVRWELIDPTGAVRTRIGTTERANMDTTNIQAIEGEWVLRMTLQDATGHYKIRWIR